MEFESEIISREFLPAVRSILAKKLSEDYGLLQKEVAEQMEVTQAAVSQYLNEKRASDKLVESLKDDPQIMLILDEAASKAAKDEKYVEEYRKVLETVKSKGLMEDELRDAEKL